MVLPGSIGGRYLEPAAAYPLRKAAMPISFKAVAHGPFARYAFAIVIVIASFLLRLALVKSFGLEFHTFMVFYPAVLLVAVLAGLWPGFLASALIVLGVEFLVVPPIGSFWITSPSMRFLWFYLLGSAFSLIC